MSDDDLGKLFRELPDEDPPDTGMPALMAAATAKAREMRAPPKLSLFARFIETFKRPPVLAFATIVVLIGGAVIVKRHGDEIAVDQRAADTSVATSSAPTMHEVERAPEAPPPPEPVVELAKPITPAMHVKPKPIAPPPVVPSPKADPISPEVAIATGDVAPIVRPTPTAPPRGMTIATDSDSVATNKQTAKAPVPVSAEQLLHECQTAANRGDCAEVRTIATRIQTSNAEFYRARVVKDAAIAKCLE